MFEKKYRAENSRRFKRFRAGYLVKYHFAGIEGNDVHVSNIRDVSAGGMKFWTDVSLPEGGLLKVTFWVPPIDRTIETLGRVVRVHSIEDGTMFYVAVRFIEINAEDQVQLNDFIEKLYQNPDARFLIEDASVVERKAEART